jgi:hypothetical protein
MPTLTRRSRFQREPTGKTLNLARRDQRLAVLRSIADYGMLTISFARALHPDYSADGLIRFLEDGYHETSVHGGPYLERPKFLGENLYVEMIHSLTKYGQQAVIDSGHPLGSIIGGGAWKVHELQLIGIVASIEIACKANGLRFISQREILAKAPQQTQDSKEPLKLQVIMRGETNTLKPDALFGIGYPDGFIFYMLEHERSRKTMLDFQKKIERYHAMYAQRVYKTHFGLQNCVSLFVTPDETYMSRMIERAKDARLHNASMFQCQPSLADAHKPPKPMPEILTTPWVRASGVPFSLLAGK